VFSSTTNSTLQMRAEPAMRGRVVALYIVAFMGSTPIGGPLVGAIGQLSGPRAALASGAFGCFVAAGLAAIYGLRSHRTAGLPPQRLRTPERAPAPHQVR
jgi:MFS family permease